MCCGVVYVRGVGAAVCKATFFDEETLAALSGIRKNALHLYHPARPRLSILAHLGVKVCRTDLETSPSPSAPARQSAPPSPPASDWSCEQLQEMTGKN